MSIFLKKYINAVLVFLALLFSAVIIGYFIWGIGYLVAVFNGSSGAGSSGGASERFDLKGASQLDYRGLLNTSTLQAVSSADASASSTASPVTASTTTAGASASPSALPAAPRSARSASSSSSHKPLQ